MRRIFFVVTMVIIAMLILTPWAFAQELQASAMAAPVSSRPTVAVKDFEFGTVQKWWEGDLNVGKGVADLLVNELLETGALRILERTQLESVMSEQDLASSDRVEKQGDEAQVGRIIKARYFITGSVTKFGGEKKKKGFAAIGATVGAFTGQAYLGMLDLQDTKAYVEITARVIDTTTGEIIAAIRSEGESKRKGFIVAGLGAKGRKVAGSAIEIGSSDFRETLLGEATAIAVENAAMKLVESIRR